MVLGNEACPRWTERCGKFESFIKTTFVRNFLIGLPKVADSPAQLALPKGIEKISIRLKSEQNEFYRPLQWLQIS